LSLKSATDKKNIEFFAPGGAQSPSHFRTSKMHLHPTYSFATR